MSNHRSPVHLRRRRFAPIALVSAALATAALGLSFNGTLAAFTASITNSTNTAGSGTLVMTETGPDGTTTCNSYDGGSVNTNAATCGTINKYGGSATLAPGGSTTTTITITNNGTLPANSFSLTPAACTSGNGGGSQHGSGNLCSVLNLVITQTVGTGTPTNVYTGTAAAFTAPVTLTAPVAPSAVVTYAFKVTLDSSAGNTMQGLQASQPLTWTFTS